MQELIGEFDVVVVAETVAAALVALAATYVGFKVVFVRWLGGNRFKARLKDK